jgi:hypothetical protein
MNLDSAIGQHHHIAGFEIAMHDAFIVSGFQRLKNLPRSPQRFVCRQRPAL